MTEDEAGKRRRTRRRLVAAFFLIAIVLLLLLLGFCKRQASVDSLHPLAGAPTLRLGDAVVTGFSGVIAPAANQSLPTGVSADDRTFIDPNGPSVRIFDPSHPGFVWNGSYWAAPHRRDIPARAVGQVFGIAIDNSAYPNIYLTSTSVYGLNLVLPHVDGTLSRMKRGEAGVQWMAGQFGPGGGPGTIWKIDGRSGAITRFAEVTLDGRPSGPAGLGNIAYDDRHHQLFVSDLSTGMIHRFSLAGVDLGNFDHGVTGRATAGLAPSRFDPAARVSITDPGFNTEDPASWGFAPAERKVWGLAVHDNRLYYAVALGMRPTDSDGHGKSVGDAGEIWSVGLDRHGKFADDPRLEISLAAASKAAPISDIVFAHDGSMIVAERAIIGSHYDYNALPPKSVAYVNRFWPETPDDPKTPSAWYQQPEEYGVGFSGDSRSSSGGVALGYGYRQDGTIDFKDCEEAIYFTGDRLRDFHRVMDEFRPGGELALYGLQVSPKGPVRGFNLPPAVSYFINYADRMGPADNDGKIGDVAVYRLACAEPVCKSADVASLAAAPPAAPPGVPPGGPPPDVTPSCTGPDCPTVCVGPDCPYVCVGPDCPHVCVGPDCPHEDVCMKIEGEAVCDPQGGGWVYKLLTQDTAGIGLDTLTVHATTPGVSVSNGPDISVVPPPGVIALSGTTPGETVSVDVCGFDNAARATGKPYDCCHTTLTIHVPEKVCTEGGGAPQ